MSGQRRVSRRAGRRVRVATTGVIALAGLLIPASGALASSGVIQRVSVSSTGVQGNRQSSFPVLSGNGRFVVFDSNASNLVAGDTNQDPDVFEHDLLTGRTWRVSLDPHGHQFQNVGDPAVSRTGRFVAYGASEATVPFSIYVYDRTTGLSTPIQVGLNGAQPNDSSSGPAISSGGRYVAFTSVASNLVPGDTNGWGDVFVYDRTTGRTERVSVSSSGKQGNGFSQSASISANGRYVTYTSTSSNLVPGDTNGVADVFVFDRRTRTTTRVSVSSSGGEANGESGYEFSPISRTGRYVVFQSDASNLTTGGGPYRGVFVHDMQTRQTTLVSVSSDGHPANNGSSEPTISATGRFVAFMSYATNLSAGDTNESPDIFVYDRKRRATILVSAAANGREGNSESYEAGTFAGSGRTIVFTSAASNLVPGDTNDQPDIFVTCVYRCGSVRPPLG